MGERRPRHNFSKELRQQVRAEQENRCAICGKANHLSIHHKVPQSEGGPSTRENAVGLCRTPCHDHVDHLTIERGIPFEQIMEKGVEYYLQRPSDAPERPKIDLTHPYNPQIGRGDYATFQDEVRAQRMEHYPFVDALAPLLGED